MSALATLPTTSDPAAWTPEEKALVEAAGLVHVDSQSGAKTPADRPTVAAFLQHCARTGLDPIARQIYCLARKSKGQLKWQIQISIDGARLVAERTRQYEGQTPVQWTADGVTWTDVWLSKEYPAAARVGVYRTGFREPLYAVATWDSYVQLDFHDNVTSMWSKFGPLMIGKCAEMLALRKAFPQDLSGLYSAEEMAQADKPTTPSAEPSQDLHVIHATVVDEHKIAADEEEDARDWGAEIAAIEDYTGLTKLANEAQAVGAMDVLIVDGDKSESVGHALWRRKAEFEKAATPLVESKVEKPVVRQWAREARDLTTGAEVFELRREAQALGADEATLEELATIAESKPNPSAPGEEWATPSTEDGAS